jgi:uncharacterized membrane protein (DUF441 family)
MQLVDDIHNWKKWWSMRWAILTAAIAAVGVAYATLPENWLPAIPDIVKAGLAYATLCSAVATAVSRAVKQSNLPPGSPEK